MKTNLYKCIKVFFVALCVIAVIVGTMGCHTQETERQTDGAVQAQECSVFPKAESGGIDLNDFFVADEEPEVDTYGDFDLREYLNACGWDRNYTRPEYGEYVVDSGMFQGAHASLTLDGYEHTMFVIRDICGLALVRIESDYPHDRVRIVDSDYDEISSIFLVAMNEVFGCIREAEDADSLEESLEAIRVSPVEINVLTYEEAEALFPEGPEVEHEVRNWYNELSNTFDLSAFLANYGWGDDDIKYASYGLRKISSDNGTIYLRLDPREAAFVVDADGVVYAILTLGISVDIKAHGILEIVILVIPCQIDTPQASICLKAASHTSCSLYHDVETRCFVWTREEFIVFSSAHIDSIHAIALSFTINSNVCRIDSALVIPTAIF
jgi:hypothetical protein